MAIGNISWEICKYVSVLATSVGQYMVASLWVLGMLFFRALPCLMNIACNFLACMRDTFITIINICLEFMVTLWCSTAFLRFRETLMDAVQIGIGKFVDLGIKEPLFCARLVLISVGMILVVIHRNDLMILVLIWKERWTGKMENLRNLVVLRTCQVKYWALSPFRALVKLPMAVVSTGGEVF